STIPALLARYRETLIDPPPPEAFILLDAVRELGSGIASWPRVRLLVLIQGPGENVILEIKELADSGISTQFPPGVAFDTVPDRVRAMARLAWATPDAEPYFGTSMWLGIPVQIRNETEAHKTVRVANMEGMEGTVDSLDHLASSLGALLARVH